MAPNTVRLLPCIFALLSAVFRPALVAAQAVGSPVTVPALIGMARLGSQPVGWPDEDYAVRSPDGLWVAGVVQRGDLANNLVDYTLIVFRTAELFRSPRPDTVLTFSSSSNRAGVSRLAWLGDNATIAFLGEHPGEAAEVYLVDIRTRAVKRLTTSPTAVTSFAIAPRGDLLLYTAEAVVDTADYAARRAHGFVIGPTQFVGDLVAGAWGKPASSPSTRTFVQRTGRPATPLPDPGADYSACDGPSIYGLSPSISPTGMAALVYCIPHSPPARWQAYTEHELRRYLFDLGYGVLYPQPMVLDVQRQTLTPLIDAPLLITAKSVVWAPDGRSVVLANAFLPLDVPDSAERALRMQQQAVAEIDLATRKVTVVAHRDSLHVLRWDARTNTIEAAPGLWFVSPTDTRRIFYQKIGSGWVPVRAMARARAGDRPAIIIDQGMNAPPRLAAVNPRSGARSVVLDPNPGLLTRYRFTQDTIIRRSTADGTRWSGGLYYPLDYVPGRRYPLVIQTHGFDSTAFAPEGASASGYAAQPLAARGVMVLQMYVAMRGDAGGSREGPSAMRSFEAAVDYLDSLGLVDRTKVGLMGWSATCYHVQYTLTHSQYKFAAAMITDGIDMSYLQYLIFQPTRPLMAAKATTSHEALVNGGPPVGRLLQTWLERAPDFSLDRVRTPLRIMALQPPALLEEWEVYAGLLLQHKPVEMVYLPDGEHGLVKPQERLTSQQGAVEWFAFWLLGQESADSAKRDQYARWRELREVQSLQQAPGDTAAPPHSSE